MKFEVTLEELEEYARCIVDNSLSADEAVDYLKSCVTGSDSFDPESERTAWNVGEVAKIDDESAFDTDMIIFNITQSA